MENTQRNNRAYGEPLPPEPKKGKHRAKDKNFCNVLKAEHSMKLEEVKYWPWGDCYVTLICGACGKKKHLWDVTGEMLVELRNLDRVR